MDSSPDLSLKLRRGSSDSRDTFYMDFAQGIDSDIEEVDNSVIARAPQQPPTPPLPVVPVTTEDLELGGIIPPNPSMQQQQSQPLPTLNESDDLPPTPPPHSGSTTSSVAAAPPSPPISPTSSILEMIPPPLPRHSQPLPASPPSMRAALHQQSASPPPETEDEADDGDVDEGEEEDEDYEDKLTPPPLPPLPSNLSYVHGNGAHGHAMPNVPLSPSLTKSPSTSPSPPDTPPPCARPSSLSHKMVPSPPPTAQQLSQIPPPSTPPSESDQSQPSSPPPLPLHYGMTAAESPPQYGSPKSRSRELNGDECPTTPPPDFSGADDMVAAAMAAAVESTSLELIQGVLQGAAYQVAGAGDENKSLNEDESTTITTPPSNGFSSSSLIAPPAEQFGEMEEDVGGFALDDIPPPAGMEDDVPEDEDAAEDNKSGEKTPTSELQLQEAITEEDTPADEELAVEERGTPTPTAATPTASGSPKRSSSIHSGSRGPSRSASRSGSQSGSRNASRSGSVRGGSIGSRQGSLAAASIVSMAGSITSAGSQTAQVAAVASPQASIKSIRSQPSLKSSHSKHSSSSGTVASPPLQMKSPPEGDRPPVMPSPPMMRSPPSLIKSSPPMMHSPPRVTSPPRVYSPPLISSPPMRKIEMDIKEESSGEEQQQQQKKEKSIGSDSPPLPSTSAAAAASSETITAAVAASTVSTTTLSYQDELAQQQQQQNVIRPHLSNRHHYHLPHQFQHPHHQNHHTHTHGSMPVPTPTVPTDYTSAAATTHHHVLHEVRHIRAASGSGGDDEGSTSTGGGGGGGPNDRRSPPPLPVVVTTAPTSSNFLLTSTETASSHASISPAKSSTRTRDSISHHRVTIDESNLPVSSSLTHQLNTTGGSGDGGDGSGPPSPDSSSQRQLATMGDDRQTGHLALMYHSHQLTNFPVLPAIKRTHRPSFVYPPMPRVKAGDALATLFSALYGKLLVVMGVAFPMAEVISTYIPPSFYEVYYLYLYIGSMIFLLFMYATLLWGRPKIPTNITSPAKTSAKTRSTSGSDSLDESDTDSLPPVIPARRPSLLSPLGRQHHYGSFYLRMGAVAFGIGSMIYSGLEFGQYFELNPDTKCHNVLLALTPATRMAFIFIQMYFIFLNNEQIKVYRYKIIARFGLMHMIGTNLAVWLNVLIQETKHEILTFYNPENRTLRISHRIPGHSRGQQHAVIAAPVVFDPTAHLRATRGLKGPYQIFECRRTNIIGTLVQDASPFLFPCTIEYSLICAAILYVMWRSISRPQNTPPQRPDTISSPMKRSPHHYSVDCARAHKGLFVGILILVLTIISLILFFVLISRPDFVALAVTEVTICELLIYGTATIATLVGMIQMRHLQYDAYRSFSLDDILLVGAQTGSFLYNIFTVIAGHFTLRSDDMLVPLNALASIVQTACQTMFILDASRRQAVSPEHIRKKPGREIVTFMLVVNLAMWAISTLEKSRAESHPIQLNFYGLWAWTIITHVSMPLAIFYRFHSTVCLCEIWKRAYKLKPTYM